MKTINEQIAFEKENLKVWNGTTSRHLERQDFYKSIIENLEKLKEQNDPLHKFKEVEENPKEEYCKCHPRCGRDECTFKCAYPLITEDHKETIPKQTKEIEPIPPACTHCDDSGQINNKSCPHCNNETKHIKEETESLPFDSESQSELIKSLWGLWESMAECGELKIGPKFTAQYDHLKKRVSRIK